MSLSDYSVFDDFMDGIFILDHSHQCLYINAAALNIFKVKSAKQIQNKSFTKPFAKFEGLNQNFQKLIEQSLDSFGFKEIVLQETGTSENSVILIGSKKIKGTSQLIVYVKDLSLEVNLVDKYKTEKSLLKKALVEVETDKLTGCYNKEGILTALERAWSLAQKNDKIFATYVIDLDGFKAINDTHGHQAGDLYLTSLADALRSSLRENDELGRFGGDEFVIVADVHDRDQLVALGLKSLNLINNLKVNFEGNVLHCTGSIGCCIYSQSLQSAGEMFRAADESSYISKKSGKNAVCIYPEKTVIRSAADAKYKSEVNLLTLTEIEKMKAEDHANSVVISDNLNPKEVLSLVLDRQVGHVVQKSNTEYKSELNSSIGMIKDPNSFMIFPLSTVFAIDNPTEESEQGCASFKEVLKEPKQKDKMLQDIQAHLSSLTKSQTLLADVGLVADELISNAIYNAPYVKIDEQKSGIDRDVNAVTFAEGKCPVVFMGHDRERIILGCKDFYGTLNINKLIEKIHKSYSQEVSDLINYGQGGAGIGSHIIFNNCAGLYVGVDPGQATIICCIFSRSGSNLKRASMPKNIHVFNKGEN